MFRSPAALSLVQTRQNVCTPHSMDAIGMLRGLDAECRRAVDHSTVDTKKLTESAR